MMDINNKTVSLAIDEIKASISRST